MDPRPNQHQLLYCNCFHTVTNFYEFVNPCRVARPSVLRSKTLPQGEFISPEDFLSSRAPEKASLFGDGDPYRIRTDVNGVRGRCLNHLTNGPCRRKKLRSIPFGFRQSSQRSVLPPLSSANASLVCVGCLLFPHPRCTRFEYTSNRLGAPSRTRTGDPLIKSQLLYQLS